MKRYFNIIFLLKKCNVISNAAKTTPKLGKIQPNRKCS